MARKKTKKRSSKKFRIKKKKSILKEKWFWLFFVSIFSITALSYFVLFSDFFQVKTEKIEFSGNISVSSQELLRVVSPYLRRKIFFETESIFLINTEEIKNEILEAFPQIESIFLKKKLPDFLMAEIKERKAFACFVMPSGKSFKVDAKGIAFAKGVIEPKISFYEERDTSLGEELVSFSRLQAIMQIKRSITENFDIEIEELLYRPEMFEVKTKNGFSIYFSLDDKIEDQLFNLEVLGREELTQKQISNLEYIDLRFGNRVFYKETND